MQNKLKLHCDLDLDWTMAMSNSSELYLCNTMCKSFKQLPHFFSSYQVNKHKHAKYIAYYHYRNAKRFVHLQSTIGTVVEDFSDGNINKYNCLSFIENSIEQ